MKTDQINASATQWQEELLAFGALEQSGSNLKHEEAKGKSHQEAPGEVGRKWTSTRPRDLWYHI